MKALKAFNQEKALVGAFSVIVQPVVEPMDRFTALVPDGDGVGGDDVEVGGVAAGAGLLRPRLPLPAHIEQLQPVQQDGRGGRGPAPRHADLQGGAPLAAGIEYYLSAHFSLSNTPPT